MNRSTNLVLKILGLASILLIYISNRPASNAIIDESIWMNDYDMAKNKAKAENRPILMYFSGSDWCKPCIQFSGEVFEREEFRSYARENLVLLRLDFHGTKKIA